MSENLAATVVGLAIAIFSALGWLIVSIRAVTSKLSALSEEIHVYAVRLDSLETRVVALEKWSDSYRAEPMATGAQLHEWLANHKTVHDTIHQLLVELKHMVRGLVTK